MTTHEGTKPLCTEVEEALAQVLDGTAPASLYDHIADCDTCRDLRHEATVASEMVAHAGADFRPAAGTAADTHATEAYLSGVVKRLDEALVSSGRVSGSRETPSAQPVAPTIADATQGTIRGMPMVDPDDIRAAAERARERAAVDNHKTTVDVTPSTLALGDDRRSGSLATAPTAFAPLSVLRDGTASEREPTRLIPAVGAETPQRAWSAPGADPSTERQPFAPAPVPPTAVGQPDTMRETQPATQFPITERERLDAELHRPGGTLLSPTSSPPAAALTAPARWSKTEPLPEHLRASRPVTGSSGAVVSATTHHGDSIRTPHGADPAAGTGTGTVAATGTAAVAVAAPGRGAKVIALFRRKPFVIGLAGAMAVAAAAGFALRMKFAATQTADVEGPWSGSVVAVSRAAADKEGGLEACSEKRGCWVVAAGAEIKPGWKLKTDSRTRAHVKLSDGTELAIDRDSEIDLAAGKKRTANLVHGMIVADVPTVADAPAAHFTFPNGDVEVLGTKLALTADGDRATVEVVRGTVRVHDDAGKVVEVRAGEEATLARGTEPTVASSTSMADVLEWSDRTPEEVDAPVLRGLGELRAKKPGETKERDRAVRLSKHAVKVRVVDVVARTEVDETFTNDTDEELEGIFRFPLPPGAQIERLALEVDGKLLDGAFVDRDRGAAIWRGVIQNAAPKAPKPREEIVWVPGPWRDPALLEWQRGGRFELKIFPIPKRGSRRVVLTYTQLVDQAAGVRRFTYPLAHDQSGTTKVDSFDIDLQVLGHDKAFGVKTRGYELTSANSEGGERKVMHADAFVPAGDLTVEYALPDRDREVTAWGYKMDAPPPVPASAAKPAAVATKPKTPEEKAAAEAALAIANDASPYVAIAVRPKLPRWQESKGRVHAIVVDTSRSMIGERYSRATRLASSIVREMDRRDSFVLLACDTTCRAMSATGASRPGSAAPLPPGAASAGEVERFLGSIEPDGGSDLVAVVSAARSAAGPLSGKELRVLYLGDGTPTVGPTRSAHIEAAVKSALPAADGGVVAVALGSDADIHSLQALARGGGGVVVPYVPGQKVSSAAIDVLSAAYGVVLRDPEIELPSGLSQVTPARLDPIRAGGETFVLARMSGSNELSGTLKLKGRVAGERFEQSYPIKVLASTNAGNAFVPRLFAAAKIAELERNGGDDAVKPTIVELSRRFAVASRFTSLLVLESEAMFNAFGLERGSVAPSFTGEQQAESSSADVEGEDELAHKEEAEGSVGNLGFGSGSGRTAGGPTKSPPRPKAIGGAGGGVDDLSKDKRGDLDAPRATRPQAEPSPAAPPPPNAFEPPADPKPREESKKGDKSVAQSQPSPSSTMAPPARRAPGGRPILPADDFRGRRMVPMKRIFERKASFDTINTLAQQNAAKMVVVESALSTTPDSRDKTVELFALYSTSGRIGEAQELTARWSGRDALDPDAITARADLAARQGDRERAVRILSGLTDVRPGDKAPQLRLADLHETSGNPALACQHRITAAELAPADVKLVADAIRCARNQGMVDLAGMLKADAPPKVREAVEKALLTTPATAASSLRGDVQLTADWSGAGDLDIALIDAQGRRISWMGSPSKAVTVSARDAISPRSEGLGLTGLGSGSYVIEISRAAGSDTGEPARGEVTLRLAGETRKVPFTLTGARAEVGTVKVFFTSRLVPVDNLGWR